MYCRQTLFETGEIHIIATLASRRKRSDSQQLATLMISSISSTHQRINDVADYIGRPRPLQLASSAAAGSSRQQQKQPAGFSTERMPRGRSCWLSWKNILSWRFDVWLHGKTTVCSTSCTFGCASRASRVLDAQCRPAQCTVQDCAGLCTVHCPCRRAGKGNGQRLATGDCLRRAVSCTSASSA